jgi:hypothetical protein
VTLPRSGRRQEFSIQSPGFETTCEV